MDLLYELIIFVYSVTENNYNFLDLNIKLNSNTFEKDKVENI